MTAVTLDPLSAAVQQAETSGQFYGRMEVDGQWVVLKKGQRKTVWIEGSDTDGRVSEITLRLNPIDISNMTNMVERQVLANSGEWSRIVWPSLRELGCKALTEIRGKWAKVALVKSGRSWTNKDGELVEGTTLKFLGLYNTEAECIAAWEEAHSGNTQAHTTAAPQAQPQPAANDAEKAVAAQFLPALVKGANGDLTNLATILASMSPVNKYFTVDSPEVQQLLKAAQ